MSKGKETTINKDKELNDCYQEMFNTMVAMQVNYSSQMIAGTMVAQALRLYKSNLTDEGFKSMVQTIANSSDSIEPFEIPTVN